MRLLRLARDLVAALLWARLRARAEDAAIRDWIDEHEAAVGRVEA